MNWWEADPLVAALVVENHADGQLKKPIIVGCDEKHPRIRSRRTLSASVIIDQDGMEMVRELI